MSAAARNGTIDLLRYFAALGIVLFHSKAPFSQYGYAALPLFVMLLAYFAIPTHPGFSALARRLLGLLALWLGWSVVYGGLKVAQAVVLGTPIAEEFEPWMLLTGPSVHLWFLPFAAATILLAHGIALILGRSGKIAGPGALIAGLLASVAITLTWRSGAALPVPLAQWAYAWPAAALGFVFAIARPFITPTRAAIATFLVLVAIASLSGGLQAFGGFGLTVSVLVFAIATAVVTPGATTTWTLRNLSVHVYLVHPAIIAVLLQTGLFTIASATLFWATALLSTLFGLLYLKMTAT